MRDWDARKGVAAVESISADRCNTIWDCDACKGVAVVENIVADRGNTIRDCDARKGVAVSKSLIADRGNTIRDCDVRKGVAVVESIIADRGNTVWDCDTRKGVTIIENIVSDRGNIFTNGNILQHITIHSTVVSGRPHHAIRRWTISERQCAPILRHQRDDIITRLGIGVRCIDISSPRQCLGCASVAPVYGYTLRHGVTDVQRHGHAANRCNPDMEPCCAIICDIHSANGNRSVK